MRALARYYAYDKKKRSLFATNDNNLQLTHYKLFVL